MMLWWCNTVIMLSHLVSYSARVIDFYFNSIRLVLITHLVYVCSCELKVLYKAVIVQVSREIGLQYQEELDETERTKERTKRNLFTTGLSYLTLQMWLFRFSSYDHNVDPLCLMPCVFNSVPFMCRCTFSNSLFAWFNFTSSTTDNPHSTQHNNPKKTLRRKKQPFAAWVSYTS